MIDCGCSRCDSNGYPQHIFYGELVEIRSIILSLLGISLKIAKYDYGDVYVHVGTIVRIRPQTDHRLDESTK